ncbi:hypothetical protein OW763_08265 [Clostridium aestuarii]|uniref:Uncharacterized protein n=1 Tax=Clostridium aestuarii TaxID=338193 RepID=A0ABT4CZE8_9CLOT|nr:hypothetical protein [Clostridium aestuarii]MCY6484350.1 hypothetical protein [Clostridium aestuarii]
MDKFNFLIELSRKSFNKLFEIIKTFIIKTKLFLIKFYTKTTFIFNKHSTIKKMYAPLINEKLEITNNLNKQLTSLEKDNSDILKKINVLETQTSNLKKEVDMLHSLILENNNC